MRISLVASLLLLTATVPAAAQLSISINIGSYPNFMAVPGYPVYYAPDVGGNYFFYDGLYWVYQDDNWYSSSWYNGPWDSVGPMYVPVYVLQVPVRYYRRPPQYFRGWQSDQPPHWNDHWGRDWVQRRPDWDRPRHDANFTPAPLPDYQRKYSGKDYPRADQQQVLQQQNYHYQPRNTGVSRGPDKQSDDRRSGTAQPSTQVQPSRDNDKEKQHQPRPAPQQDRQDRQDRPEQQVRRAPPQDQHPPATPNPEQTRAPATHEPGNAGAGASDRKSSDSGQNQEQKPHKDQPGKSDKRQAKDQEQDKDHKHD